MGYSTDGIEFVKFVYSKFSFFGPFGFLSSEICCFSVILYTAYLCNSF